VALRNVARLNYDPRAITTGIVHLGLGNFHRAHQAVYTDDILARDPRWGICGVSLKSRGVVDGLRAQDHLYSVVTKSSEGTTARIIGSVREALSCNAGGADDMAQVIARIAAPATHIVTLTITEKGYCHDPASGKLNFAHPDIAHDLQNVDAPRSALGALFRGLCARKALAPRVSGYLTILSSDNLPHNGATLAGLMREFSSAADASMTAWIEDHVTFPSSMVDRIVPATTETDIIEAAALLGTHDAVPVMTEPFSQWVIEDHFAGPRPAWEEAGAQLVKDVAPYELMKLRLLNAAHSAMAYLGYLAGHEFIYQASADPLFARMVERLWDETAPTLSPLDGFDVKSYRRELMARFRNTVLPHRTWQIAMDGSQKLPQRILNTVRARLAEPGAATSGEGIDTLALVVAGWMRYVSGIGESDQPIDVRDPLAAELGRIAAATRGAPQSLCNRLLALQSVFGDELPQAQVFTSRVQSHLAALFTHGARGTLALG
jgi:fructuronate reductase